MQQIPQVTREDVIRVVCRDFPPEVAPTALTYLDLYGGESNQPENERVQLAILKLSRGDLEQLQMFVAVAQRDFGDVIVKAENPNSFSPMFGNSHDAHAEKLLELQQADWQRYNAWLSSEVYCGRPEDSPATDVATRVHHGLMMSGRESVRIPGWAGIVLGPILGIVFALRGLADPNGPRPILLGLGVGASLGFVAGLVVWANDLLNRRRSNQ